MELAPAGQGAGGGGGGERCAAAVDGDAGAGTGDADVVLEEGGEDADEEDGDGDDGAVFDADTDADVAAAADVAAGAAEGGVAGVLLPPDDAKTKLRELQAEAEQHGGKAKAEFDKKVAYFRVNICNHPRLRWVASSTASTCPTGS